MDSWIQLSRRVVIAEALKYETPDLYLASYRSRNSYIHQLAK